MLSPLKLSLAADQPKPLTKAIQKTQSLIEALNEREIPVEIAREFQSEIDEMNESTASGKALTLRIQKGYQQINRLVQKELGLVPKAFYRNQYMSWGLLFLGIPFGIVFALSMDNWGLLGICLPIGFGVGIAIGSGLDEKAEKEGRQLDI